jgi:hypothetical protein
MAATGGNVTRPPRILHEDNPDYLSEQAVKVLNKPDVQLAMRYRCQEQGHQWVTEVHFRSTFPGHYHRWDSKVCAWCDECQT